MNAALDSSLGLAPWVRLVRDENHTAYLAGVAPQMRAAADVFALVRPLLEREEVEVLVVIILDAQHRVLAQSVVTRGTANSSLCAPRDVFRIAIALGASSIIVAHNHPSGDPTPSPDDRAVTQQLLAAGVVIGIPVCDHVIVGANRFVSFAEQGLL